MKGCGRCMKTSLFIANFVILLGGIVVLVTGVWTVIDQKFMENLVDTNLFLSAAFIEIASGCVAIFISFLGCYGALREVRCMLLAYTLLLFLLFVVILIAGILGYVFKGKIEHQVRMQLDEKLLEYDPRIPSGQGWVKTSVVTQAWDDLQTKLRCCGVETYQDWGRNKKGIPGVFPNSCCEPNLNSQELTACKNNPITNPHFYRVGCVEKSKDFLMQHGVILGAVGITIAFIMLIGIIFGCALFKLIE